VAATGHPVHTIGHSNHSLEDFVALLRGADVRYLVDVRTVPRSRANPQFNADVFANALAQRQIGYARIGELGGLRGRRRDVAPDVNGYWENASFHNYADHALSEDFRTGLRELDRIADQARCAVMCAEAVWWRCHRRIIADYLLLEGREVLHIMPDGRIEPASVTPAAVPHGDGLAYPAALKV
jgi:uncharacterized protein (DUF488 family)